MKISELVALLEQRKRELGDVEVFTSSYYYKKVLWIEKMENSDNVLIG